MPNPEQILAGLQSIANSGRAVAVLWHLYFAAVIVALALGVRPSRRIGGVLLALPFLSVSIFAWAYGNPFNGVVFALAFVLLTVLSLQLTRGKVRIAPLWCSVPGALFVLFGWVYPHFLVTSSFLPYLYSAPTGLIPCPTLSAVIGLALILSGLDSRALTLSISIIGLLYGLIGVGRLGVTLDLVMLAGAAFLLVSTFLPGRRLPADEPVT